MKIKVGTVLDKEIVQRLKIHAAKEGRTMNEIIYDALTQYFRKQQHKKDSRRAAVDRLCSRPFNLNQQQVDEILEEDYFEQ